jgi:DNA-binding transcriptional LysR family regulator
MAVSDYLGKGLLAPVLRDLLDEDPPLRFEIITRALTRGRAAGGGGRGGPRRGVTGQDIPRGLDERHLFDQAFVWVGPRRARRSARR